ncbi:hypothetical protein AB4P95_30020 (plasmid) [Pseudomonas sp. A1437]|uniref:hypothetical protein n=1 Tax=Pseudomonas sp. A1437 TaxID=3235107 RepID=UPI0037837C06
MKTRFTWAWVAKAVATGPIDSDLRANAWEGSKLLFNSLLALILRTVMLVTFPVSVPALVYGFRLAERRLAKKRAATSLARRAAQDADV